MSQTQEQNTKRQEFIEIVRETFAPHTTSKQYRYDHPEGDLPREAKPGQPPVQDPHNDGADIYKSFSLEPLPAYLQRAAEVDHSLGKHPKALPHFLTHLTKDEKWEIKQENPEFGDIPEVRKRLLEWFAGIGADDREAARSTRTKRLRNGGTGIILHGEQGTTKTTAMYWLVTNLMEVNQSENVLWQSTLDDTEWQVFAPWATLLLPRGVEVQATVNPHSREYRDLGAFQIGLVDICREVIRYDDPEDITELLADRVPGQFYVVYPDPHFRGCQSLTSWEYESMWEVESSDDATDLNHFWFALMEAVVHSPVYGDWTTLVGDEAHKWLRQGKGNDEHDWWNKIDDWATYWGDARKKRLSVILSVHKWHELHKKVRDKIRWGATMNGEEFPTPAPATGRNIHDQDLGDMCVWNSLDYNHVGYPDLKQSFSVPADIAVTYPGFEAETEVKS